MMTTRWMIATAGALVGGVLAPRDDRCVARCGRERRCGAARSGLEPTSRKSEKKANLDFTLKDMNGARRRAADYKGKVVLINFWATWCPPCKVEIPGFVEAYRTLSRRGLRDPRRAQRDDPPEDLRARSRANAR